MLLTEPNKRATLDGVRLEKLLQQVNAILDYRPGEKSVISLDTRELKMLLEEVRDGRLAAQ